MIAAVSSSMSLMDLQPSRHRSASVAGLHGETIFSSTVSVGKRLVIWNERPIPARVIASGVSPAIERPRGGHRLRRGCIYQRAD
jgi:hypothetical protein